MLSYDEYAVVFPLYEQLKSSDLEVHHLRYFSSRNPWDVEDDDLVTLCHSCHVEANKYPIPIK